jgi:hypothetical protein
MKRQGQKSRRKKKQGQENNPEKAGENENNTGKNKMTDYQRKRCNTRQEVSHAYC